MGLHRLPRAFARAAFLAAAAALAPPGQAAAQAVRGWEVASDNDAYDFWIPRHRRPDHDYTHGMWLAAELGRAPVWGRRLGGGAPACTGRETGEARCLTTRVELAQKLFTPRLDDVEPVPGERAYAGWLSLSARGRREGPRSRTSAGLEVGVTGDASLGRLVYQRFHRAAGFHSVDGWGNQLAFEPGIVARLSREVLAYEGVRGGERVAAVVPEAGLALGNVLTGAHAGVGVRLGRGVPHPWRAVHGAAHPRLAVFGIGAARGEWVGHDLFLDGNTFRESVHVRRRPFVYQYELGGGVRWRSFGAEYRATTRGRDYQTQLRPHQWSTIALTLDRVK